MERTLYQPTNPSHSIVIETCCSATVVCENNKKSKGLLQYFHAVGFFVLLLSLGLSLDTNAQCAMSGFGPIVSETPPGCNQTTQVSMGSNTYSWLFLTAGAQYEVSTCGSSFDTQLSVWKYDGNANNFYAYGDDNGPWCGGTTASLTIQPAATDWYRVQVNRFNCQGHDFTGVSAILKYRQIPPTISAASGVLCSGASTTITATQSGGTWSASCTSSGCSITPINGTQATFVAPNLNATHTITYTLGNCAATTTVTSYLFPTATISGPTNACVGSSVTFTGVASAGSGTITNITFRRNSSTVQSGTGTTYTINPVSAAHAGVYDITVTQSNGGCSASSSNQVTLNVNANPTTTVSCTNCFDTNNFCYNGTATLSAGAAAGCGTISTYQWSRNGSPILVNGAGANLIVSTAIHGTGTHNYRVVVTNSCAPGCSTTSADYSLTSNPQIFANAGSPQTICPQGGSSANLGGSPSGSGGTGALTYLWTPATGLSSATVSNPIATPLSTTFYTLRVTDSKGCTATSTVNITVQDITLPTITCPFNVSQFNTAGQCGRIVSYTTPSFGDNCPSPIFAQLTGLSSGSFFPVGVTTNTFRVTDVSGNTAQCSFTVTIVDNEFPLFTCPASLTKNNDINVCGAVTTFTGSLSDNCPGTTALLLTGFQSGSTFPVGTTLVSFRATDASGNSTTCSFNVTVNDVQAPSITCPANISQGADGSSCGGTVSYSVSSSDNCTNPPTLTLLLGLSSGSLFPVGTTTVRWRSTDAFSNSATCTFTVTINETAPPVITCPASISVFNSLGSCGASVAYSTPTATDNCITVSVAQLSGLASGAFNPVGVTTNVWRATDLQGNSASCSFTVTVVDNKPPTALCKSISVTLSAGGSASIVASQVNNGSTDECGVATLSVTPNAFGCSNVGANTVTLTVTDVNGNAATCSSTVTIIDATNPVAACQNITIQLNGAGSASIIPSQINSGSSDACGFVLTASQTSFGCVNVGNNTITLTATDPSGNTATCTSTVTVQDVTLPVAICKNITVQLNSLGTVSITPAQINNGSSDACGVTLTASPTTFGCVNTGANTVTLTVKDPSLNTSTCTSTVTVQDLVLPVALCKNITVNLSAAGAASIVGAAVNNGSNDACGIATLSVSPNSFTCANVGGNAVTLTVTDTKGNVSTCGAVVTIQDATLPNAICQNITLQLNASGVGSITAAQVNNGSNDACGIQSLAVFPSSFNCSHVGAQQVVLTVTDVNSNQNTCIASVNVQDLVPPVALCQSYTLELDFAGTGTVTPANINNGSSDACGIQNLGVTGTSSVGSYTNAAGVFYNCNDVGTSPHTIVLVVTDVNSNTATCTTSITVIDNIPPVIECNNVTKNNDVNVCQAFVSIPAITILDNCLASGITSVTNSYTGTNNASGTYPVGTTSVTWTVTDAFNNTSTCVFTVTVVDNQAPTFDNPINTFTITNPGVCLGTLIIPTLYNINDNCGVQSVVNSYTGTNNATGNYPEGLTVILWTVTDIHGNVTTKPQFIAVIDFENPAVVSGTCPGPITIGTDAGVCKASVALTAPSYTDNCGIGLVFATVNNVVINGVQDNFNFGTTTIVWKAIDINGNYNQTCSQTITVVDDDAPAITCPANVAKNTDLNACSAVTAISVPATSDNCGVQSVTNNFTGTNSASGTYPVGTTTVIYTVRDIHNNTTTCTFTVTVTDNQLPTITCPANITQSAGAGVCTGAVSVSVPATADNCTVATVVNNFNSTTNASGTYPVGSTTVIWTVTDVNGNSKQCTQTVTVNDEEVPSITCASEQTQSVDAGQCGANVSVTGPSSDDNCGVDLVINDYNGSDDASDNYAVGTTTVTWIVLDVNGNVSQCEQNITVVDDEAPAIGCAAAQTQSVDAGVCEANMTVVSPLTSDNCAVDLVINDYTGTDDASGVYPVGTTTLTWIVLDIYGNVNFCTQDLTVVDDENPTIACAANQTQTADAGVCNASVAVIAPLTNDNCSVDVVVNDYNGSSDASDVYPVGATTLTWTVLDIYGNPAQCTQTITVTDDELPVITCDIAQAQTADAGVCNAAMIVSSPIFSDDNCGVASVLNDFNNSADASDTYPVGTTVLTWTVTDVNGNTAQCTQSITITDDELPAITCAANQAQNTDLGACDASVTVVGPSTSDNCAVSSVENDYNGTSNASDTYPIGTTTITWTVTDIHGHSVQCSQDVTISDVQNPGITCAPNQTQTADANVCNADVVVTAPVTSDNCGVASVSNNYNGTSDASDNYLVGTSTIIWTVTDVHGNSSQCTQTVIVTDNEAPLINCPSSMVVNTNAGVCQAAVTVPVPATADNCGVASLVNNRNGLANASGTYPLGLTTVKWTVTDIHGITSTCTITITVIDIELPTITCPPNKTVNNTYGLCTGNVVINLPSVGDNCGVAGYSNNYNGSIIASDTYPAGVTTVTYTVNDVNGNSNLCSFTVTVKDIQPPFVACPTNVTQTADAGVCEAYVIIPEPFTSDNCGMDTIMNDFNDKAIGSDIYPVGTTTLIWTAIDVNGNTTTCTQTVKVTDDEYPVISCDPHPVYNTDAGVCEAFVASITPNVGDNCGVAGLVNDYTGTSDAGAVYLIGTTTITWTVTDIYGNNVSCQQDVTVVDGEAPSITCPLDVLRTADPTVCHVALILNDPATDDNCGVASYTNDYTNTNNPSAIYSVGTTTVTYTVVDFAGNATTCTFSVTITDDEAPIVNCPMSRTQTADAGNCSAYVSINDGSATDNCDVDADNTSHDYAGGVDQYNPSGVYPVGSTTVTFTVPDIHGNTSTCSFIVTIIDNELPTITCPGNIVQTADAGECEAGVSVPAPGTGDNCGVAGVVNNYNGTSDASDDYNVGTTTVKFTVSDIYGNTSTCNFTVTITDNEAPSITCPTDITRTADPSVCNADIFIANPVTGDNCSVDSYVNDYTGTTNASANYIVGTTTVTYSIEDIHGNTNTCAFTVTITDDEAPVVTCPASRTQLSDPGVCSAYVEITDGSIDDNCDPDWNNISHDYAGGLDQYDPSGDYPAGLTTVTFTVPDIHGNVSTCSFTVTIVDDELPQITCPVDVIQTADAGLCEAAVSIPAPLVSDNCVIASVTNDYNGTSDASDVYQVGVTVVMWTVVDTSGNLADCAQSILITDDENPTITCPATITQTADAGQCNANVTVSAPVTADNCAVAGWTNGYNGTADASDNYPVGTTSVGFTVIDASGNYSTCSFTITITDNEVPVITCIDQTQTADPTVCQAYVTVAAQPTSDNCGVAGTLNDRYNSNNGSGTYPVGTTSVVWTVTDIHGNTSSCTQTITVTDDEVPVTVCQDVTIQLSATTNAGSASITTSDINNGSTDNCGIASYALDETDFDCSEVGANTVVLTVTDIHGNSNTCSATVTVEDNVAPIALCQDVTIQLSATTNAGSASITTGDIDNGSSDNCGIASLVLDETDFDCSEVGANTVVLTVTDVNGNTTTCSATVTVEDNVAPIALCQDVTIQLSATTNAGSASITTGDIDNGSSDNCTIASLVLDETDFDCSEVGANTVVLTVTDVNGNTTTCSATVTVEDNVAPIVICQDVTIQLSATTNAGSASITTGDIDNGSSDNCGIASLVLDETDFDCSEVGANTVVLTVTDVNGNTTTCSATVTVEDNVVPIAICQDVTIQLSATTNAGSASITTGDIDNGSSDNCGVATLALDETDFDCSEVGANTVVLTVTDVNGNTTTCSATVTVEDNVAPIALCQDVTIQLSTTTNAGSASITTGDIDNGSSDNCGIASLVLDETDFDCSEVGANTVVLTVTDVNGNSTTCSATVTVEDNVAPIALCQNITINLPRSGTVGIVPGDVDDGSSDNCGVASLSVAPNSFLCTDQGPNTVVLTVTDVNGNVSTCTATVTVTTDPMVITVLSSPTFNCGYNISCNGNSDGSVALEVEGGCLPYSYAWSNGAVTEDLSGLTAGTYDVTITDANGDDVTGSITLTEPDLLTNSGVKSLYECGYNISCNGANNGSIDLSVAGGCPPYTYNWVPIGATTQDLSGLSAGVYKVIVTDANGCKTIGTFVLTQPAPVAISSLTSVVFPGGGNVSCNGSCDGSIDLEVDGGADCVAYTYNWSGPAQTITTTNTVTTTATISGNVISSGNGNGGSQSSSSGSSGGNQAGNCNVSNSSNVIGAVNLTFADFDNIGDKCVFELANELPAGTTITIRMRQEPGQSGTSSLKVYNSQYGVLFGASTGSPVSTTNQSWFNQTVVTSAPTRYVMLEATASADFDVDAITYSFVQTTTTTSTTTTTGPAFTSSSEDLSGLCAGTYNVTITDANGCSTSGSITLNAAAPIVTGICNNQTVVFGYYPENVAQITTNATGGITPYTYLWSTGETTSSIQVAPTATTAYSVTVTDAVGCSKVSSSTVTVTDIRCGCYLDRVSMCDGSNKNQCVKVDDVPAKLSSGWKLGTCPGMLLASLNGGNCGQPTLPTGVCNICTPSGHIKLILVKYLGPNGATVRVRNYPQQNVFQIFTNVQNGEELVVNGTYNSGSKLDYFTYLEVLGSSAPYALLPTDCNNGHGADIVGRTYGNFKVLGLTDVKNNTCGMPTPCACSGGIAFLGLTYNGAPGATINVYAKDNHVDLLGTWSNLQPGDSIIVRSDVLNLSKLNGATFFEVVGFTPDLEIQTNCGDYLSGMEYGPVTVFGWIDKDGGLCNMPAQPACACNGGVSSITMDYDKFDSLSLNNATIVFFADLAHLDTIVKFTGVDAGDQLQVSAAGLPGGIFPALTYVKVTAPTSYTVSGNGVAVGASSGVSTTANAIGVVNGTGAFFTNTGNYMILDLGNTLPAGKNYTITWKKSGTGTASMKVSESTNNSTYTQNSATPATTTSTAYVSLTLTTGVATRYLKIESMSSVDFYVDAAAYSYVVTQTVVARPDIKLNTSCAGVQDAMGGFVREMFIASYTDLNGNSCDNACGVGKTIMCHTPSQFHSQSHASYHQNGNGSGNHTVKPPHTHCVKNKDVNKKLQQSGWALGPCPVNAKPEFLETIGEQGGDGFMLTAQPNPFNEATRISFRLAADERVNLSVYNIAGVELARLFEGAADANTLYQFEFNANQNPDGMYFYRLVTESGDVYIRKLILTK